MIFSINRPRATLTWEFISDTTMLACTYVDVYLENSQRDLPTTELFNKAFLAGIGKEDRGGRVDRESATDEVLKQNTWTRTGIHLPVV